MYVEQFHRKTECLMDRMTQISEYSQSVLFINVVFTTILYNNIHE